MIASIILMLAGTGAAIDVDRHANLPAAIVAALPPVLPGSPGYLQVVIEQEVIIRVPARRTTINNFASPSAPQPPMRESIVTWKEKKAPKCVAMRNILGMQAVQRNSIDLITRQNQRLRAQLNRGCRALDFYAGFYMQGNKDGRLCEDRDQIHARTGAKCEIDKFRLMVPVVRADE